MISSVSVSEAITFNQLNTNMSTDLSLDQCAFNLSVSLTGLLDSYRLSQQIFQDLQYFITFIDPGI